MLHARRSGFTLVELIIAIVLLAILGTTMGTATYSALWTYEQVNGIADVNQTARAVIERMCREIRAADSADYTNTAGSTTLTLYYPAGDPVYPPVISYSIDKTSGRMTYQQGSVGPWTLVGSTGDDITISDASLEIEYREIDDVNQPCLVKIYIVFNNFEANYPFAASACLRRWMSES